MPRERNGSVKIRFSAEKISLLKKRLEEITDRSRNMRPAWDEASKYMLRSTQNRFRTRTGPDGERWPNLAALTVQLKGHDKPLYDKGDLYKGIKVKGLSKNGFSIESTDPKSEWHQKGVKNMRGKYRPKAGIPPRPFIGFSDENNRRIAKILRDYIDQGKG
jgi:phage gpG-like protein